MDSPSGTSVWTKSHGRLGEDDGVANGLEEEELLGAT